MQKDTIDRLAWECFKRWDDGEYHVPCLLPISYEEWQKWRDEKFKQKWRDIVILSRS